MVAVDWCHTPQPEKWGHVVNYVTSYPLDLVTTLQPFANNYGDSNLTFNLTRIGPPAQLHLNDLGSNCATVKDIPWRNHIQEKDHDPQCNPILDWRTDLNRIEGHSE
jgi:hypothetical protein